MLAKSWEVFEGGVGKALEGAGEALEDGGEGSVVVKLIKIATGHI